MTKMTNKMMANLSKLLKTFLNRTLVGPGMQAQTPWVRWVYNLIQGGTYNSPYIGKLRIPMYPLTMLFQNENVGPYLERRVKRANKFLQYQFHRLEAARLAGNSRLYWAIVLGLIRRSTALHVLFLNRVVKGWYFRRSFEWSLKLKSETQKKAGEYPMETFPMSNSADILRAYVKKPNGKMRPVGSPSIPDRIHQSALSFFVTHWTEPRRYHAQHGFRPGRGIWSAWFKLITEFLNHETIVEYDLRSFFNRVPLYKGIVRGLQLQYTLEDALDYFEFPKHVSHRLLRLMQSTPHKLPEEFDPADAEAYWMNPTSELIGKGDGLTDEGAWIGVRDGETVEWTRVFNPLTHGMTQGSPLSPTLSGLFLDYINLDKLVGAVEGLHFADDGLFAFKGPQNDWKQKLEEVVKIIGRSYPEPYKGRFENLRLNNRKNRIYQTCVGLINLVRNNIFYINPMMKDLSLAARRWLIWKHRTKKVVKLQRQGKLATVVPAIEFNLEKSRLIKSEGKWLVEEFKFLGSVYNTREDTLNGIKISNINLKSLWKVVGKTYNVMYPDQWSWGINPNSILWRLITLGSISGKLKFIEPMLCRKPASESRSLIDPTLLLSEEERKMITQSSTLSCGLLLHAHERQHRKKPLSLICEEP